MTRRSLVFLPAALALIAGAFGASLWAQPPSGASKNAASAAKALTGTMANIKAGKWTDSTKATAADVSITLNLSEDGASVAEILIHIGEEKFEVKTAGSDSTGTSTGETQHLRGPFPIAKTAFKTAEADGKTSASGSFVSAKEAQGHAHLYSQDLVGSQLYTMDLGEWQWKATAK